MSPHSDLCYIGNYDNQGGGRILIDILTHLRETIEDNVLNLEHGHPYIEEHDDYIAALDMFTVMVEHYKFHLGVTPQMVRHWRDLFMPAFDKEYGQHAEEMPGSWEHRRRNVILGVFAHLEQVVASLYQNAEE